MTDFNHYFPVNLSATWQDENTFQLEDVLRTWLLEPSSLTAKLKARCQQFKVVVIGQQWQACSEQEANEYIHAGEQVLVREVLLYCDDIPQVFARSLLPFSSLTGEEQQLAHLGDQPLGQVLFNNPNLVRSKIEVAKFPQGTGVSKLVTALSLPTKLPLWGRRSLFFLHEKPLMVAEVFLPNSFAYQAVDII